MIPQHIENALDRLGYNRNNKSDVYADFLCMYDLPSDVNDALDRFVRDHVRNVETLRLEVEFSLVIERAYIDRGFERGFRIIVFETNWQNTTCVADIIEDTTLQKVKRVANKQSVPYQQVKYVRVGSQNVLVADPFAAAVALMPPPHEPEGT